MAIRTIARMAAFMPGASPPDVKKAILAEQGEDGSNSDMSADYEITNQF